MPNIPQITAPVSNNKSYSFTNRQYDGNIEPFDMVELAQPIKTSTAQDNDSAAAMMMGRKNLAPLTVQIKDPTMAVETLKNLLSSDLLEQTMINGYTELYDDMNELIKSFYLAPEKLVREIQNQEKQNTMFSGDEFYKLLHGILKTTTSPDIKKVSVSYSKRSTIHQTSRRYLMRLVRISNSCPNIFHQMNRFPVSLQTCHRSGRAVVRLICSSRSRVKPSHC